MGDCIAKLERRGFDLPLFYTTQNARDVRAVMSALGHRDYNIYGVSYGTKLALEVMRKVPGGVRSVVLDSVAPLAAETLPNSQAIVFPETGHGALLFSQCARDIGEAFLEDPDSTVNTSCVADLRLPYLMPDGSFLDVR